MMGRLNRDQGQLFYSFCLDGAVPVDHGVREIAAVLDLSWVHGELAPHYSPLGRPSPEVRLAVRSRRAVDGRDARAGILRLQVERAAKKRPPRSRSANLIADFRNKICHNRTLGNLQRESRFLGLRKLR